ALPTAASPRRAPGPGGWHSAPAPAADRPGLPAVAWLRCPIPSPDAAAGLPVARTAGPALHSGRVGPGWLPRTANATGRLGRAARPAARPVARAALRPAGCLDRL